MDAPARRRLIEEICSFEGRGPGTDAERRAAKHLAKRLEAAGRRAELEPTYVHSQWALVHAAHGAIAIAGSLIGTASPGIGFAMVLFAATSAYLDLQARFYLVRRLFFKRASQNIVSPGNNPGAPVRLILVAHYDAGRTGYVFGTPMRLLRRLSPRAQVLLSPFRVYFWLGIAPLLPVLGAQMAGFDPGWLQVVQLLPTMLLIVAVFLLIDIALSEVVPGAYGNASGVAAVLSAAEEIDAQTPEHLDVWVVLPGAGESLGEGMRSFVTSRRKELRDGRTAILGVDSLSHSPVGYEISAGAVASVPLDSNLASIAASLADADRGGENRYGAEPVRSATIDDALVARLRGIPALTITDGRTSPLAHRPEDKPGAIDDAALSTATEFLVSLVRLLDRDAGRRPAE